VAIFFHGAMNIPLGGLPSFLLAPQLWYALQPAGKVYVMKSDRYVPGVSCPDGGSVGADVGLGGAAGVAIGAALAAAVGTDDDGVVGLVATTPAVHALARSATAMATTDGDTRAKPLMS
jgi:hypothetical protein